MNSCHQKRTFDAAEEDSSEGFMFWNDALPSSNTCTKTVRIIIRIIIIIAIIITMIMIMFKNLNRNMTMKGEIKMKM